MIDAIANVLLWLACMGVFWFIARTMLVRRIERERDSRDRPQP